MCAIISDQGSKLEMSIINECTTAMTMLKPVCNDHLNRKLMRLVLLVAPLQVLAACQMYSICAVITVGQ